MNRFLLMVLVFVALEFDACAEETLNLACLPTTKIGQSPWWAPENYWLDRIARKRAEIDRSDGTFDLVFIGDSITHNWEGWPEDQWREIISRPGVEVKLPAGNCPGHDALAKICREFSVLNLGMGGDTTGEVLWRLRYGKQLSGYRANAVCLMIGTNNRDPEARQVANGIEEILREIRERQPQAKVFLLPIFPRAERPDDPKRLRNEAVNALIRSFADGERIVWVDFNQRLLEGDGTISREMMPDYLHPGPRGYEIWAEELLPRLRAICK